MDFELTEEQKAIKDAAREFAEKEFTRELAEECDREEKYPRELYKKAGRLGFIALYIDEVYGGQGYGTVEDVMVIEEFHRRDPTLGAALLPGIGAYFICLFGDEEQKATHLPRVARGELVMAGAFTEPRGGSDILSLDTVAVRDGEEYVINGTKTLISRASVSDYIVVLCQTDPKAEPAYRGQSTFLVAKETEGIDVTDIKGKLGNRAVGLNEVAFDNVRVPKEALLGQENRGFHQSMEYFNKGGRPMTAAQSIGMAQGALDRALSYAKAREAFGRPIGSFQAIGHKLADMAIKVEAARTLVYKAAWAIDVDKPRNVITMLSAMAKCYSSEVANEVIDEALQIFGGYGFVAEYEIERFYRDARVMRIYEGTSEILRDIVARRIQE